MPSLFKQQATRYVNAEGTRVPKDTAGAKRIVVESRKWYGEFTDSNGEVHRVALARDRTAAQAMLAEEIRLAERRIAGLVDPYEEHEKLPISQHIREYERHLEAKGNTKQHSTQTAKRIRKLMSGCKFTRLRQIEPSKVENWLDEQQRTSKRFSAQTRNFYLDAAKYFCNWLVERNRAATNPLSKLTRVTVEVDRRHDRRALSDDEFARLIAAAREGQTVEGISGPDRAILYVLSAWTGFRRKELASLTRRSFDLEAKPALVQLTAKNSKRRKLEQLPLHQDLVGMLRIWLEGKPPEMDAVLFQLKTPKGYYRKTAKMMRQDLKVARATWLNEAEEDDVEYQGRSQSQFLTYQDAEGLFADFHANRHTFISNLGRSGVSLMMAQKLARHSDPRLTANRYTHLNLDEKANAIDQLPSPPIDGSREFAESDDLVTGMVTGNSVVSCPQAALDVTNSNASEACSEMHKPLPEQGFVTVCHWMSEIHPSGVPEQRKPKRFR